MRKLTYILFLTVIAFSCDRDDVIEGTAVSFYPTVIASGAEQDGNSYVLNLETSQFISGTAEVTIELEMSSEGVLETTPPLDGNKLTVEFSNTKTAQVFVTIGNDAIPDSYTAVFRIVSASNGIQPSRTNKYTLNVRDTDTAPLFSDDFEGGLDKWTLHNEGGSNTWGTTSFDGNTTALVSGFGSSSVADEDNWMVSPEINFDVFDGEKLQFISKGRFNDQGNELEVSLLQNYDGMDPSTANKTVLDVTLDPHSGAGFGTFTNSGDVDLSGITGVGHLAFRYKTVNGNDESGWELDDVLVSIFEPSASNGGSSPIVSLPFSADFEECTTDFAVPAGFDEVFASDAKTDRGWGCRQEGVDDSRGVRVSSFGGDAGFEDAWLISEARLDFTGLAGGILSFDIKSEFSGDGTLRVYYSDFYLGGDPNFFSWTEVDVADQLPTKGSGSFTNVSANLAGVGGKKAFIAFRFDGATELGSATYTIDNVLVEALEAGSIPIPFSDDFESCTTVGDFNIPTNWIEAIVPGSKTDRGWGCRAFGRNGSNAPRASAFGGEDGTDDAWLISDGKFDLSAVSSATLVFWLESRFSGPGDLEVKWSANYTGSGDPTAATWTTLSDVAAQYPADGSEVFTEITGDLSGAAGQKVFLAFRYFGGTASGSIALTIDDVSITGN